MKRGMKMKKLLLSLGMVMTVVLLTACGSLDAFDLLDLYSEAEADIDSFVLEMVVDIGMSIEGMSVDMLMTVNMEAESEDRSRTDTSMEIMGQSEETTIFVRDGNEYAEERIDGGVVSRSRSEFNEGDSSELESTAIIGFLSEDTTYDSSATREDDGYRLEFVLNLAGVSSLLEELELGDVVGDQWDESEDDETANIMVMYLDEDYMPISFAISLVEIDVIIEGEEATMTLDIGLTAEEDVTIDFPDWLDVDPVSEADLVGVWTWDQAGIGNEYLVIFASDGTGALMDNTEGTMIFEDFTWEILNDNHLYTYFEANIIAGYGPGRHEIIDIDGGALSKVNLDEGIEVTLYFVMTVDEFIDFLDSLEEEPVESSESSAAEDDLVGTWEWDISDTFQLIFNEDGTGEWIGIGDEFTWEVSGDEILMSVVGIPGTERWHFEISGQELIITNIMVPEMVYTYIRQ